MTKKWGVSPFTGYVAEAQIALADIAHTLTFSAMDWILDGDWYVLVTHTLNTADPIVLVRDSENQAAVNRIEVVDNAHVKLWVPSTPDLRFSGKISLLKN